MANAYNIGTTISQINLGVDIISIGLATSRASVLAVAGTDPSVAVAHSVDASGNIAQQSIGDYTLLKGKRLSVFTKVTLTGMDADSRATEAASVDGTYTLLGGDDGTQVYNNADITYQDPNVFLTFTVDLT